MATPRPVVRIAHAGNTRERLARALASDCDMIEVDLWYRGGDLRIHHEHKVARLPLLADRIMPTHARPRFALRIGRYYVRPDIGTLRLDELLATVAGRKRLLLDIKGRYSPGALEAYVEKLLQRIRAHRAETWVALCGSYSVLRRVLESAPEIEVRHTVGNDLSWERFLRQIDGGVTRVCMAYDFIDDEKARLLEHHNVDLYCWTVDNWDAARRLVAEGVDGIISNDLQMLSEIHDWIPGALNEPLRSP
jgi:glycerophosphoryl diester phosphodiesterase